MDDPSESASTHRPSLLERLSAFLSKAPDDRNDLLDLLHSAHERKLLDDDALGIIEGAMAASEVSVRDVMVPRAQMDVVDIDAPLQDVLAYVLHTAHSRFPVVDGDKDNVLGILLAKDLLRAQVEPGFSIRPWLRPVVFVPESKRLNVLLREFRASRNHMAVVVDEYGGVAGVVTIEDVLEQIVGNIEDEYDFDETEDNIRPDQAGRFRVKALTGIADFNAAFATHFDDADCDTVGGMILNAMGRVPKRNEEFDLGGVRFMILRADGRRLYTLLVTPLNPLSDASKES